MTAMPPEGPMPPDRHAPGTRDGQGRRLCTSPRNRGRGPCDQPQVAGFERCRMHLGFTVAQARKQVQEHLALLAVTAAGVQAELLTDSSAPPAVRRQVARDVLELAGHAAQRRHLVEHVDLSDEQARHRELLQVQDELAELRTRKAAG